MKNKYRIVGFQNGKQLECIVNASNKYEAINIANLFFKAFDFDESEVWKVK